MALTTPDPTQVTLGAEIRRRRQEQRLTLTELAELADISHPFLSQLERGLARPSMMTLERIAKGLNTTQVNLMIAGTPQGRIQEPIDLPRGAHVVRAGAATAFPQLGTAKSGFSRLLVPGAAAFYPQEQIQQLSEFADYYCHDQDEWVYVISGWIEVDLGDGRRVELRDGDSLYYAGGIPHRWRSPGGDVARLLIVQAASQE